jgi:hypothetical protein
MSIRFSGGDLARRSSRWFTAWETAELRVAEWDHGTVVFGVAGIHARRMPHDRRRATRHHSAGDGTALIVGVVERSGKYVLCTEGRRPEVAVIRKLRAPNSEIGLELEKAYPEVEVYYEDR